MTVFDLSSVWGLGHRNVQQFRGGLVFQDHRLLHHLSLGLGVIKKKKRVWVSDRVSDMVSREDGVQGAGSTGVPRSYETLPPRILQQDYTSGPMVVLGAAAVSYERGTPLVSGGWVLDRN